VLSKLTREDKANGGLDLAGRDGGLLVVCSELGGLGCDALEDVVDERVKDGHGAVGDTGVRVDLLEDLVDVRRVGLLSGLGALLLVTRGSGGLLASLLLLSRGFASWRLAGGGWGLLCGFGRHFDVVCGVVWKWWMSFVDEL